MPGRNLRLSGLGVSCVWINILRLNAVDIAGANRRFDPCLLRAWHCLERFDCFNVICRAQIHFIKFNEFLIIVIVNESL